MNKTDLTTNQRILLAMYNEIAIGELELGKLADEDLITYSNYFYNHMTSPSNYVLDTPLTQKIVPIYDALDPKEKETLLDIIFNKDSYRNEFFYDSVNLDIPDDEKDAMTDEEVTKYLKENDYILGGRDITMAETKLISELVNLFTMMIDQVDSYDLDKTTKEEYIERALFEIDGFIESN